VIPELAVVYSYNTVMILNNKQVKYLRGMAHSKKPVVTIGNNGFTPSVLDEINYALSHHELIKVKLPAGGKTARRELVDIICIQTGATSIAVTGRTAVIFRQTTETSENKPSKINIKEPLIKTGRYK
jgi:RNA-binding protein